MRLPPSAQALGAGVASVVLLTSLPGGVAGYPYANRNTDKALRFRITTNALVAADSALVSISIRFSTEFNDESGPFQPVVLVSGDLPFYAASVTSQSFVLKSPQGLASAQSCDFFGTTVRPDGR